jgi:hypothetical protein
MAYDTKIQIISEVEAALVNGGVDDVKALCNRIKWEAACYAIFKKKLIDDTPKSYHWKDLDAMAMAIWPVAWGVEIKEKFMKLGGRYQWN